MPSRSDLTPDVISGIPLVYVDDDVLVLDKPDGLLSVPGRGEDKQDCLSARVQRHYPDALVVHRLDMSTSGLMLMARNAAVQRALSQAFASRSVRKRYVAVVAGHLMPPAEDDWGVIDLPIVVDWLRRPLRIIDSERGKPSVTRWRVLNTENQSSGQCVTRLELEPVTGRSHQLRVHLRAMGHAILGDRLYASLDDQIRADRLLLHACALSFTHPATGRLLSFDSPPPF